MMTEEDRRKREMSKLPKKLRMVGNKLSVPPDIESLLDTAASRIEELEAEVKRWVDDNSGPGY